MNGQRLQRMLRRLLFSYRIIYMRVKGAGEKPGLNYNSTDIMNSRHWRKVNKHVQGVSVSTERISR